MYYLYGLCFDVDYDEIYVWKFFHIYYTSMAWVLCGYEHVFEGHLEERTSSHIVRTHDSFPSNDLFLYESKTKSIFKFLEYVWKPF